MLNSTAPITNFSIHEPSIYVDYWESVVHALVERSAPLDVIWGYELRQEHHFHEIYAPLSLTSGLVTTANGETYDMSKPDDKDRMVDEGLVYWADTIRRAIRDIDPTWARDRRLLHAQRTESGKWAERDATRSHRLLHA